jgi:hypothetical protein
MSRRDHSNKTRDVAARLARDGWTVAAFCLSMIFSENRYPLFGIML